MTLEKAISAIANGQRVCPRCGKEITVDAKENNIHFCAVPAPELAQGSVIAIIAGIDCPNPATVIAGRRDPNLQKAVRLMREKYKVHEITGWALIQVIVP